MNDLIGRKKSKWSRVTRVELKDLESFFFKFLGFVDYGPTDIIQNIVKLIGLGNKINNAF